LVEPRQPLEWKLDLRGGRIVITTAKSEVVLWVDAHHPVVQVDARSLTGEKLGASASFELWRKTKRPVVVNPADNIECYEVRGPAFVYPDTVLPANPAQIGWYHRNPASSWMETLDAQNIREIATTQSDPLLHRTFGAILRGVGKTWKVTSDTELAADPAGELSLRVHILTAITDTAEAWLTQISAQADAVDKQGIAARRAAHAKWWADFCSKPLPTRRCARIGNPCTARKPRPRSTACADSRPGWSTCTSFIGGRPFPIAVPWPKATSVGAHFCKRPRWHQLQRARCWNSCPSTRWPNFPPKPRRFGR